MLIAFLVCVAAPIAAVFLTIGYLWGDHVGYRRGYHQACQKVSTIIREKLP